MVKNKYVQKFFNKNIVVDASIMMKFFIEEEGKELVYELVELHLQHQLTLMATPLFMFEMVNALSKTIKDAETVYENFLKLKEISVLTINLDDIYIKDAIKSACDNKQVSYYDASYQALAKDFDTVFLTADEKFYEQMKDKGNVELFSP